jgi:hypothetical protein
MISNIKYFLFFFLTSILNTSSAQEILDFKIILSGVSQQFEIHDTIIQKDGILIEHKSDNKINYCQESVAYPVFRQ